MTLSIDERKAVVAYRLQKAQNAINEARETAKLGYWHTAANRLYYACFYAVTALLLKNGLQANTHSGVISVLGQNFVNKGIISKEENRLYGNLFELRHSGDYDDWKILDEKDVLHYIQPAEDLIKKIETIINK
ncbi:MAG: HEPN domain-containing protein [Tannerella sp.]|jgi:uncharacterized protein (UPF0332 family)|nr:HEPN domain-containing protein [Tannerella sp.]